MLHHALPCGPVVRIRCGMVRASPRAGSVFGRFPGIPSLRRLHPGLLSSPPSGRKRRVRAIALLDGRKICFKGPVSAILRCSDACGRARRSEGSLAGPCCAGDLPPFAWRTPDVGEGPAGNSPKNALKALEIGKEMYTRGYDSFGACWRPQAALLPHRRD